MDMNPIVRFETNNRLLFFKVEEIINEFLRGNEEPNRFENEDNFENEELRTFWK